MKYLAGTPQNDGFFMPAEWQKHKGVYMVFPERCDVWRSGAKYAQEVWAQLASAISEYENVTMLASAAQLKKAGALLPDTVRVLEAEANDAWVRDTGPSFVVNNSGGLRGVDWVFNAWGGSVSAVYDDWQADDALAKKICDIENAPCYKANFVLEGGSVHTDGEGTVLVTESCLLSAGRNPHLNKKEIENNLKAYLGAEKIVWLPCGIYLDETGGHIDNIACFVRPAVIALSWTDNKDDPQYELSNLCSEVLHNNKDAKGRSFTVHRVPLPQPLTMSREEADGLERVHGTKLRNAGDRLAASYINYYTANGAVFMPGFGVKTDKAAHIAIQALYPKRKVIQLNTREILLGGGNIHCITQQVPSGGIN